MAHDLSPSDRDLCSQSTISRLENLPDARALLRMGRAMIDLYCESFTQVPKRITLDIDDMFDAVHGGQQLRLFNAHYDEYGFQPIVVFDGAGRFVTAVLRPARRPGGKEIRALLRRLVRAPKMKSRPLARQKSIVSGVAAIGPRPKILLRGDSHYCNARFFASAPEPRGPLGVPSAPGRSVFCRRPAGKFLVKQRFIRASFYFKDDQGSGALIKQAVLFITHA